MITSDRHWMYRMIGELHVLFGAGQVGHTLARLLLHAGERVRIAKRSISGSLPGAETIQGDATDPEFCARAATGAATVYHCMNPPYDARLWAELVPRWMDNLIAAAGRAGARLVVLDSEPTDVDQAAAATVAWAEQHYSSSKRPGQRDAKRSATGPAALE
jgi:uncharacterized protein YbjT (DUF2867 family)